MGVLQLPGMQADGCSNRANFELAQILPKPGRIRPKSGGNRSLSGQVCLKVEQSRPTSAKNGQKRNTAGKNGRIRAQHRINRDKFPHVCPCSVLDSSLTVDGAYDRDGWGGRSDSHETLWQPVGPHISRCSCFGGLRFSTHEPISNSLESDRKRIHEFTLKKCVCLTLGIGQVLLPPVQHFEKKPRLRVNRRLGENEPASNHPKRLSQ